MNNILFVCMGNICRSPMAEALLKTRLSTLKFTIHSAGLTALVNKPADIYAQEVLLKKKDIDISSHRARQVTLGILHAADLILVMEQTHQNEIGFQYPSVYGRVHRLGKWGGFDIPDPYRRPKNAFAQTLALIESSVNEWQKRLWT